MSKICNSPDLVPTATYKIVVQWVEYTVLHTSDEHVCRRARTCWRSHTHNPAFLCMPSCEGSIFLSGLHLRMSTDSRAIERGDVPLEADTRIWSSELIATVRMSVRWPGKSTEYTRLASGVVPAFFVVSGDGILHTSIAFVPRANSSFS
jgi:hypothetical protein